MFIYTVTLNVGFVNMIDNFTSTVAKSQYDVIEFFTNKTVDSFVQY